MRFILEDTWTADNEADDIIEYSTENAIKCKILTVDELYAFNTADFFRCVYFCNTDIVQYHLSKLNKMELVPNTYDSRFHEFYKRNIETMTVSDFNTKYKGMQKFIKPYDNNKEFDGRVISDISDFKLYGVEVPDLTSKIYCCEPVRFLSEVRLLVGNNKLYGHGHICKNKIDTYLADTQFINSIISLTGTEYLCVDIGYVFNEKIKAFQWIIIEINPPFSLDDHQIPFADYIAFCIDACNYINGACLPAK